MEINTIDFILASAVFIIYGSICIIAIIFTFALDTYIKIHDALNFHVFSTPILTPIERSIDWFDAWAMKNHGLIGPFLIMLSIIDLKAFFDIINAF
jgi:hypothetical protein